MILDGKVSGHPLTSGTVGTLHTFFSIKTDNDEIAVKCDFLCYVRVNDTLLVDGDLRENQPMISSYKIEGKYFEAKVVENKTLKLKFKRP